MGVAGIEELNNLADNWCHDRLDEIHYGQRTRVYELVIEAYKGGYEQALQDVKDGL